MGLKPVTLITKVEYARRKGFSKQFVNKLLRTHVIRDADGMIDEAEADELLAARRNPAKPLNRKVQSIAEPDDSDTDEGDDPVEPDSEDFKDGIVKESEEIKSLTKSLLKAKLKTERERGRFAEIQRLVKQGKLVEADKVHEAQQTRATEEREALLNFSGNFGPDIAAELNVDRRLAEDVLNKYVRIHLQGRSRVPLKQTA